MFGFFILALVILVLILVLVINVKKVIAAKATAQAVVDADAKAAAQAEAIMFAQREHDRFESSVKAILIGRIREECDYIGWSEWIGLSRDLETILDIQVSIDDCRYMIRPEFGLGLARNRHGEFVAVVMEKKTLIKCARTDGSHLCAGDWDRARRFAVAMTEVSRKG